MQETPTPMSDAPAPARADHLIEQMHRVESLVGQLAEAMNAAVEDLEALGKTSYREGGKRGVDTLLGAGATVDGLYGKVRGRLRAHGLERLLERQRDRLAGAVLLPVAASERRLALVDGGPSVPPVDAIDHPLQVDGLGLLAQDETRQLVGLG